MPQPGRLQARPAPTTSAGPPGLRPLRLGAARDATLYAPPAVAEGRLLPLAVLLHGAGGHAEHGLGLLRHAADAAGLLLVAPASTGRTWDVLLGGYGPDVAAVDRALAEVFSQYPVDPGRLAVGGFSDGASYALSLGLTNGDLFTHVLAFSPGFAAPAARRGRPRVFVSHGTEDAVLPVGPCSRRIVPRLRGEGYGVKYAEFEGGHTLPPEIAAQALGWFLGPG